MKNKELWFCTFVFIVFVIIIQNHLNKSKEPELNRINHNKSISGNIYQLNKQNYIYLENLQILSDPNIKLNKIRIKYKYDINDLNINDKIRLTVNLYPIPKRMLPNSFDLKRHYHEIDAFATAKSEAIILSKAKKTNFQKIREKISDRIEKTTNNPIIPALLLNQRHKISTEQYQNIRNSGLAHLIAISGLHIGLIASFIFISIRYILSFSYQLCLRYNIKKVSAIAAILLSLFYLNLISYPISATRAFIMISTYFIAILYDKKINSINIILISVILFLLYEPNNLFNVSFQLTFAAALALSLFFGKYYEMINNYTKIITFGKYLKYPIILLATNLVATIATMPIILYHFKAASIYAIFANLFAVPLISFIALPAGLIAIILMPVNLEFIALTIMEKSLDIFLKIASYTDQISPKHLDLSFADFISYSLLIISIICLFKFKNKYRNIAAIPMLIAIINLNINYHPDLIILPSGKNFIVNNNKKILVTDRVNDYQHNIISNYYTNPEFLDIDDYYDDNLSCDNKICLYQKNDKKIIIIARKLKYYQFQDYCNRADLLIDYVNNNYPCSDIQKISYWDLRRNGSYVINIDKQISIKTL
jgi:competence protein ComEC